MAQLTIEKVYERLHRVYNIEKDELDALGFDTSEKVMEYYTTIAKTSGQLETDDEKEDKSDPTPVDNYRLTPAKQAELNKLNGDERKQKKAEKRDKFFAKAADLSHLPPEERVTQADAERETKNLLDDISGKSKKASKIRLPKA